jgi:SAM-dependent methyltransferase
MTGGAAARRWAEELAAWAIPAEILDQAPESPWGFPPALFARSAEQATTAAPSGRRALEALPEGGSVLDVGAGGGAGSLPLAPPARRIVAVDESPGMLEAFAALAEARGLEHAEVEGTWPAVASKVASADVVVCHHVLYNVADLPSFAQALTGAARHRVVIEITERHPQTGVNDLWRHFWGIERPTGPTALEALVVLRELGLGVDAEDWEAPARWAGQPREEVVAFVRRRLCLPAERDPEVDAALGDRAELFPRRLFALWWNGSAG